MTQPTTLPETLPDPEPTPLPIPEETRRFPLAVPLGLAAGWGALITFSVIFFLDEAKIDTARAATARTAFVEPAVLDAAGDATHPAGVGQANLRWEQPDTEAPEREPKSPVTARPVAVAVPAPMPVPRSEDARVERADYIGTWGPTSAACAARSRRRGYIPAIITEDGAQAGRTQCRFRNGRRDGVAFTTTAECSDRGRRWTSQVRLVVDGDRLTWTSAKGPAFYVRCGRRDG